MRLLAALQDNVVRYEKEFGKMTATNPKSRDHASSLHSAMDGLSPEQQAMLKSEKLEGYEKLNKEEMDKLGIKDSDLKDPSTGFKAEIGRAHV